MGNEDRKKEKKEEGIKNELSKIIIKLEKADIKEKDILNIQQKLKRLMKAGIKKENLNTIVHLLIMKIAFRDKFLKHGIRKLPRILAEFGIHLDIKLEQLPRQAESTETFGSQNPLMAVSPIGDWIAQAAEMSTHGNYRIELYRLENEQIAYDRVLEFIIKGDKPTATTNNRIKALCFNNDGSILWVSAGTEPSQGPFKTWLVKYITKTWQYETFGPVFPYNYYETDFSRSHFAPISVIYEDEFEKLITTVPTYPRMLAIFNPSKPNDVDSIVIDKKPENFPNFFIRFVDIKIMGNDLLAAGWAENCYNDGINNPRASLVVVDLTNRSVKFGPFFISEMMGYYDSYKGVVAPLKVRPNSDLSGAYLIAEELAPKLKGGRNPDHSGFAYIEFQSGKIWIRDTFPYETEGIRHQMVRNIFELKGNRYMHYLKRDKAYNTWRGLIRLDDDLNITDLSRAIPEDWWPNCSFKLHPKRPNDFIISAVRVLYHPNFPSGLIALWEAF